MSGSQPTLVSRSEPASHFPPRWPHTRTYEGGGGITTVTPGTELRGTVLPVVSAAPRSPGSAEATRTDSTSPGRQGQAAAMTAVTKARAFLLSLSPCVAVEAGDSHSGPDTLLPPRDPRRGSDCDQLCPSCEGGLGLCDVHTVLQALFKCRV